MGKYFWEKLLIRSLPYVFAPTVSSLQGHLVSLLRRTWRAMEKHILYVMSWKKYFDLIISCNVIFPKTRSAFRQNTHKCIFQSSFISLLQVCIYVLCIKTQLQQMNIPIKVQTNYWFAYSCFDLIIEWQGIFKSSLPKVDKDWAN